MSIDTKNVAIFAGSASLELATKIAEGLGLNLGDMEVEHFADGEFSVYYKDSIRGKDVFLVQSTYPSSDNIMELLLMIDAAKRASAHYIAAVIPYFGWARQDRKDKPRVSIGAKLMADLLSTPGSPDSSQWTYTLTRYRASSTSPWITFMLQRSSSII